MTEKVVESAQACTLYCTDGGSDKVYQASLRASGDLWVVEFAYGKRGQTLKPGTKTNAPVDYKTAKSVFDKLVKSKTSGGYVPDQGSVSYTKSETSVEKSGYLPMLPISLEDSEVQSYLNNEEWYMQEKKDGENRQILIKDGSVRGINRKGFFVDIPQAWVDSFAVLPNCVLAGEAVGEVFYVFDLVELHGRSLSDVTFGSRYVMLDKLVRSVFHVGNTVLEASLKLLPVFSTKEAKLAKYQQIQDEGGEGVVYKNWCYGLEVGKTKKIRKHKFVESATCVVMNVNTQRSVEVGCFDATGSLVGLGNVTIPANHLIPGVDELVEIRYLYRFEGGCFEQPVYLGVRTDLERSDAVISQITRIKLKSTSVA